MESLVFLSLFCFIRPPSVYSSRIVPVGDIPVGDEAMEIAPTAFRGCILRTMYAVSCYEQVQIYRVMSN